MPRAPKITLPRVDYREGYGYNPRIDAYQVTGTENIDKAIDKFAEYMSTSSAWGDVALDIETKGVDDGWWQITCITAAFHTHDGVVSVLLNPLREPEHRKKLRRILDLASRTVFHNCFSGDTRFITRDGVRTLEEVSGETVEVWDGSEWRKAEARYYGASPTQRIVVFLADHPASVSHEFNATPNHRWELVDGRLVTTEKLVAGDLIKASKPDSVIDYNSDAFKHGLIFADRALYTRQPVTDGVWGFQMRLCGDKAKWVHLFDRATYPPSSNGDPVVTGKLPFNPKDLPENPDADYIANFIEGWQLFDGADFGNNRTIGTVSKDAADWLATHAPTGGWYVTGQTSTIRKSGYSNESRPFHTVVLSKGGNSNPVEWIVDSVDAPTDPVPVYCVEVPDVERFTLAEGVYTANSTFDTPPLVAHELMTLDDVNKIWDTLVLARMLNTVDRAGRSLEDLAVRYGIVPDDGIKMASVFSASGMGSASRGFSEYDIDSGTYRDGAMSDTVVTLRLLPILEQAVTSRHDASVTPVAGLIRDEAWNLICELQRVNQISLRRAARGYLTDPDFRDNYEKKTYADFKDAEDTLSAAGLEPGRGDKLIEHLYQIGQLPGDWPKTPTGKLSADKSAIKKLTELGHPLAAAHRTVADTTKILGYLEKVNDNVRHTGRLHPMIGVLGAAATGRMSVTGTELHQFPGDARGILISDTTNGWSSVDWSTIEPVTMAVCAGDDGFLEPFFNGGDLYIPVARAAGLIPPDVSDEDAAGHAGRKAAKVIILAAMYGQGKRSLAANLAAALKKEVTTDEAGDLHTKLKAAMPVTFNFMRDVQSRAELSNTVITITGRVLDEDPDAIYRAVNHFCQGSAADVLYQSTLELDRQGLSDHIHLWMHDELIVDTSVEAEVVAAMQKPPEALLRWARTKKVMLRTDANPMGGYWKAV